MMKPSVKQMHEHVMSLIKDDPDFNCNWITRPTEAMSCREFKEIWIPKIKSRISYAVALHEIGHMLGRHQASRYVMVCERDAWRWAKANALIWTETMEKHRNQSLAWYEAQIKDGLMKKTTPATICSFPADL